MAINFTSKAEIERLHQLAEGGEAVIYEYDDNHVLKLFKSKVDISKKSKKVKYLIQNKKRFSPKVIGPTEEVTIRHAFAAYLMKKLLGNEDMHMLTKKKFLTAARLTNKDVLEIMIDLGNELNNLHKIGFIVGDVSDYNFQFVGKSAYLLDADSWGAEGIFSPDAYTELFTCPDSYMSNGTIKFSKENEYYNFAVLVFYMLTRIHPFGGTYLKDKNLSIVDRMKKKISVVGKHKKDIKIPKIISSWKWMSPKLEQDFIDIFENGKKFDITPDLKELFNNMKYCSTHDIYYYSKFSECPLCNEKAKVNVVPTITKVDVKSNGPKISIIFEGTDCAYVLSPIHYLNKNNEIVHFESGRKVKYKPGYRVDFSDDGSIVYIVNSNTIKIFDENNNNIGTIERMNRSNYVVKDKDIFFVDRGNNLTKLSVTKHGNMPRYLGQVYLPILDVSADGKVFHASLYPKRAIVTTSDYTFEIDYSGKIREYGIKYDRVTKKWLFIYQLSNGKYRTIVFNKNKVEYDDDIIMYNTQTLDNIEFCNNTIYDPSDGKIIGTNLIKNTAKEFTCSVVDESSKLEFTGKGFKIYNQNNIYNYG